ncbi:MAG: hypothetical protein ACRDIY_21480 [Chloroflexota bacterium]
MTTPTAFSPEVAGALRRNGWTLVDVPAGLTLAELQRQGAPFRGTRYFRDVAPSVVETPTIAQSIAYQPDFLPGSLNRPFDECAGLVAEFGRSVPVGCRAIIGQAAMYVDLIWRHAITTGAFPLSGGYTWTSDQYPDGHLVIGVFGRERPIIVGPHPKSGRGIGVMPLIITDG